VIIFAGKAHPNDGPGQQMIEQIHAFSMQPEFLGKILLLEGYDMALARHMVSGVDVWLNTPEHPLEASGTSGQKAGLNGAINLSVLDGWWAEGYTGDNGWGINPRDTHFNHEHRLHEEATELLDIIEHEVLPTYFNRDSSSFSNEWVKMSKASMKTTIPRFNSQRMLRDYVNQLYRPAQRQRQRLEADGAQLARQLADWKRRVRQAWSGVTMELMIQPPAHLYQDEKILLRVRTDLQGLDAEDVKLECLLGRGNPGGELQVKQTTELLPVGMHDNYTEFEIEVIPEIAGLQYYKLRMYPFHEALSHPFELGCMIWV